jgi:nitrate/nitrite transporter NarK
MAFGIVGGALGPWLLGLAYDTTGSYAAGFWVAIGCCFVSAISIWLAAPRRIRAVG